MPSRPHAADLGRPRSARQCRIHGHRSPSRESPQDGGGTGGHAPRPDRVDRARLVPLSSGAAQGQARVEGWRDAVRRRAGVHARTTVAAEGTCRFTPRAAACVVRTAASSADGFRADRDVVQALPASLQRAIAAVRPRGLMSLSSALDASSTMPAVLPAAAACGSGSGVSGQRLRRRGIW